MICKNILTTIALVATALLLSCEKSEPVLYPNCERILKSDSLMYKVRTQGNYLQKLKDYDSLTILHAKPFTAGCIDDSHLYLADPNVSMRLYLLYITIISSDSLKIDSVKQTFKKYMPPWPTVKTMDDFFEFHSPGTSYYDEYLIGEIVQSDSNYLYVVGADKWLLEYLPFSDLSIYKHTPDTLVLGKKLINAFLYSDTTLISTPMKSGIRIRSSRNGGFDIKYFHEQDSISITVQGKVLKPDSVKKINIDERDERRGWIQDYPPNCRSKFCEDSLELLEILHSKCSGYLPNQTVFERNDGRLEYYHYNQVSKAEYAKFLHEKGTIDSVNFRKMRCAPPWYMNVARKYGIIQDY